MTMTNEEIVQEYKLAKDKKKQIQILADLNTCKYDDILKILEESDKIKQQELPRTSKKKAETTETPGEPQDPPTQGEMNDLEKAMSEVITDLRGENDALKGRVIDLEKAIDESRAREEDLQNKLLSEENRVKQLEDELADTKSALESTEKQLDDELRDSSILHADAAMNDTKLRNTIAKLKETEQALMERIDRQDRIIESMANAFTEQNDQSQKERTRTSEVMMRLIEKFVLN